MKPEEVKNTYYHIGALNEEEERQTPHILDKDGNKVFFLIRCHVCHHGLCKVMTIAKTPKSKQNMIFVQPCPTCLEAARKGEAVQPYEMNGDYQTRERF